MWPLRRELLSEYPALREGQWRALLTHLPPLPALPAGFCSSWSEPCIELCSSSSAEQRGPFCLGLSCVTWEFLVFNYLDLLIGLFIGELVLP